MDPINYRIDVANPLESAVKGYQVGTAIQDHQLQQQQKQFAFEQQQQQAQALRALIANPNAGAQEYANAALLAPGMREQLKQAWDTKNTAQQQSQLSDLSQWSSAIQNGKPQIAVDAMNARADAMESTTGAPTRESQVLRAQASAIKEHPEFGNFMIKALLSAHPDGGKVIDSIAKMGSDRRAEELQPGLVAKGTADASAAQAGAIKAGADAQVATATVPALSEKPELDNRIAELNAQIAGANSETQRGQLTLERDKLLHEQKKTGVTQGEESQTKLETAQQAIDTVTDLLQDPFLRDSKSKFMGFGNGVGSAIGKFLGNVPGTENMDYREKLKTMQAQLFLPAVAQLKAAGGAGALSDAEGKKLDASVRSLNPDQKAETLETNLKVVLATMKKFQNRILAGLNVPTAGGGFVANHPEFGKVTEGDINRVMQKNPGATRELVMQILQMQKAK